MKQHHGCPLLGQAPTSPCQRNIDSQEEAGPHDALCNLGGYVQRLLQDVVPVDEESWDDIHRDIPLVAVSAALSYSSLAGAASCQKAAPHIQVDQGGLHRHRPPEVGWELGDRVLAA